VIPRKNGWEKVTKTVVIGSYQNGLFMMVQPLELVEKTTLRGGMTETRLGIPAPMGEGYLSSIEPAFGGPKGFFNSSFSEVPFRMNPSESQGARPK